MNSIKVLELFSGSQSVSKEFIKGGHQTFTVDNFIMFGNNVSQELKDATNLHMDIMDLTPEIIIEKFGRPDVIWASPPCTKFSVASIGKHWIKGTNDPKTEEAKEAVKLVKHVLWLIKELNPKLWFIENPRGKLRKLDFMQELPRDTITYCQYNNPLVQELIFNMKTKKCSKCGEIKNIDEFYKNVCRRDGFHSQCKECMNKTAHEHYENNKEIHKQRLNEWKNKNREYVRERDKKYRKENPDIEFQKQQRYREKHKEKLYLKGKKYREENRDYFYNKARERKLSKKAVSDGTVTLEFEQYLYELQNGKCGYCGCELSESGKHLDHIVPLSKGGLHTANNVHWTCPTCNLSKGNKLEEEWLTKERCKPTDIWCNHPNPQFKPACKNGDPCHVAAPRGSRTGTQGLKNNVERAKIPQQFCEHIVHICEERILIK